MRKSEPATKRGKAFERSVEEIFNEDYQVVSADRFFALRCLEQPIYASQCSIGHNIYGKNRRVDFILYHPKRCPECMVIQCKWQGRSGSVEEKYPFEVLSTEINEFPTIIVLDGGGYTDGAKNWLKSQAGQNRLKHVLSLGEFQTFYSRGRL